MMLNLNYNSVDFFLLKTQIIHDLIIVLSNILISIQLIIFEIMYSRSKKISKTKTDQQVNLFSTPLSRKK